MLLHRRARHFPRLVLRRKSRHAVEASARGARRVAHDLIDIGQQRLGLRRQQRCHIGKDAIGPLGEVFEHDPVQQIAEIVFFAVGGDRLDQDTVGIELLRLDDGFADRHLGGETRQRADFSENRLGMHAATLPDLFGHEYSGDGSADDLPLRFTRQHRLGPCPEGR